MARTEDNWQEAQRRCRMSDEEIRMAKELGFRPQTLIRNIPSRSQSWKLPVNEWVRRLHAEKFDAQGRPGEALGTPATPRNVIEFRNPEYPWPDRPEIRELVVENPYDFGDEDGEDYEEGWDPFPKKFGPPAKSEVDEQNTLMLRRQCLLRWAAQFVGIAMSELPEVQKVVAFGGVAAPLQMEVPRFYRFRRYRIEVLHECNDLDLALWMTSFARLKSLKKAQSRGLQFVQDTPYGGVAHHQVDVHIMDAASGAYRGRLCIFGQCPKPGKLECLVPGCGDQLFLQQFERYHFHTAKFAAAPQVTLFDRDSGLIVRPPRMEATPTRIVPRERKDASDITDEDLPF